MPEGRRILVGFRGRGWEVIGVGIGEVVEGGKEDRAGARTNRKQAEVREEGVPRGRCVEGCVG